jgi:hypothetical protein
MPTRLTSAVTRVTSKFVRSRPIVVTLAPAGSQDEALIGLRLLGTRTTYVVPLSDVYRNAALQHGLKEAKARRDARKAGIPWRRAKKDFDRANSIPAGPARVKKKEAL